MTEDIEVTLPEWVGSLHKSHGAVKEYKSLLEENEAYKKFFDECGCDAFRDAKVTKSVSINEISTHDELVKLGVNNENNLP